MIEKAANRYQCFPRDRGEDASFSDNGKSLFEKEGPLVDVWKRPYLLRGILLRIG